MVSAHDFLLYGRLFQINFVLFFKMLQLKIKVLEDEQSKTFINGISKGLVQISIKSFGLAIT